jgi:L-amino acid N-acyltransferase YncA
MEQSISIEALTTDHWEAVRSIYLQGIATGNATFQQSAPAWEEWDAGHLRACRIVARTDRRIVGWAALSPVSRRPVYRGVAEVSIYVAESARGCDVGTQLMARLIVESEAEGIWTLQAASFPRTSPASRCTPKQDFESSAHDPGWVA